MKPVTIKFYVAIAEWSEGPEEFQIAPTEEECQRAIDEWNSDISGSPYHGFRIRPRWATGYIVEGEDEE